MKVAFMAKRIYLDVCVLSRPFDDQNQARIRLETGALQIVLAHIRSGELTLIVSPVHWAESGAVPDPKEKEYLELILSA